MPAHVELQTIGGWRTTEPLGAGGMGTVFRAEHAADRRVAALKIARVDDAIAIDSVRREVALLGRIRHPGVVALVDHGLFERRPWYAMELVEGPSLADHIDALWGSARSERAPDERRTWVTRPMRGVTNPPGVPVVTRPGGDPAVDASDNAVGTPVHTAKGPRPVVAGGRLKETLQLVVSLCQTLGYLHGEGIVHLDLKPTNILLRHGDQPVVVDFGITRQIAGGLNREVLHVDALQGGTDHYMAPEQVSTGLTDARTDLYALGCILFEALTGRPPFLGTATTTVREQHLSAPPPRPSDFVDDVPPDLDRGVLRLLEKKPEARMGHASDLIGLLVRFGARIDPALAVRKPKPYLYRPRLVGRDVLLDELRRELHDAQQHSGRCVFLLGQSGAGKTRLAMELGREAVAADMRVVSGECLPVTVGSTAPEGQAGRLLHPFRTLLSTVVDLCNAGGPDVTKALVGDALPILENLEPAFANVPGRAAYPAAFSLSVAGATGSLERALAATILATAREKPLFLVIDDLQWADALSIAVLRALCAAATDHRGTPRSDAEQTEKTPGRAGGVGRFPLCVVATCRTEEVSSDLAAVMKAKGARRLDVEPLTTADVASLISDMIAYDDAPRSLVDFIGTHSAGNPFFVAEYLRAAVDAGHLRRDDGRWVLSRDGDLGLPARPDALVDLRVKGLSYGARDALEWAAVLGRGCSRDLLNHGLAPDDVRLQSDAVEELLQRGILLEDGPTHLRFAHDKLREASYVGIPNERRARLHLRAANAIESHAPVDNRVAEFERAALLVHHTREAGLHEEHFVNATRAGELANRLGAHRQAGAYLHEALTLSVRRPEVTRDLADLDVARLWSSYGAVLENLGQIQEGVPALERGLALLGFSVPSGGARLALFIASQLAQHVVLALAPASWFNVVDNRRDRWAFAAESAAVLARGYVGANRQGAVLGAILLAANLARRTRCDLAIASSYSFLGGIAMLFGVRGVTDRYLNMARAAAVRTGTLEPILDLAQIEGFAFLSQAQWDRAQSALKPALDRTMREQRLHLAEGPMLLLNYVHMLQGELDQSDAYSTALLEVARKTGNERYTLIGALALALNDLYRGEHEEALRRLESLHDRVERFDEHIHVANFHATRAAVLSHLGRHEEAVAFADKSRALLGDTSPTHALLYNVHAFTPEAYLRAWHDALARGAAVDVVSGLAERSLSAIDGCTRFSRVCPYALPLTHRFRGQAQLLRGEARAGLTTLQRALATAQQQRNLFEQAQSALALALASPSESEKRRFAGVHEAALARLRHQDAKVTEALAPVTTTAAGASALEGMPVTTTGGPAPETRESA